MSEKVVHPGTAEAPGSALLGADYSPAEIMESMAAVGLRQEREIEELRLAICGGEDAPGYAMSLPLQAILDA